MTLLHSFMALWQEVPSFILSVSFGTQAIRLGLFQRSGSVWRLIQVGSLLISPERKPADYAGAIHEFLKKFPLAQSPAVVSSWRAEVIEKPVVLPHMPSTEVRAAIKFAMEHHFSIKVDECLYDWVESADVLPTHGMKSHQYFVYAVPRKDAVFYLETLQAVSGDLVALVPHSFAFAKLLATQHTDAEKDMAYLEIDEESSNFQIFRKDRPLLSRAVNLGYRVMGPQEPAIGLPASSGAGKENTEEDEIQRLRPYIEKLQHAIQSSIDFYHQQSFGGDVSQLFLCENAGVIRELDRYLELGIEMPVTRPSAAHFEGFEVAPAADAELQSEYNAFIPMLGTFLTWKAGRPNLLPTSAIFKNQIRSKTKLLRVIAIGVSVLAILINLHALIVMGLERQKLNAYRSQSQTVQEFQAMNAKLLEGQKLQSAASSGTLPVVSFMKFLSQTVPSDCVILDIDYDKSRRRVDISALVIGSAAENAVTISAQFVGAMTQAPFFDKVDLTEGIRDAVSGEYRFRVTAITHES